jgi:transcriptional regulator with XRE-family HTH domain
MTAFIPKKLPLDETLGEKLRQARSAKKLKIEEAAKILNIRPDYLTALEEERWDKLPAGLYGKNFLKQYAGLLRLNPRELLSLAAATAPAADPFSQKIVQKNKFIVFPKIVRNAIIVAAILACLLYLVGYFKKVVLPPELIISAPAQNLLIPDNIITVSGRTEPEAEVRINNEIVLNNHGGDFSQTINLKKGLNNIIISAKKKYSQSRTVTRQILVE